MDDMNKGDPVLAVGQSNPVIHPVAKMPGEAWGQAFSIAIVDTFPSNGAAFDGYLLVGARGRGI
jgi:hypothetical protein